MKTQNYSSLVYRRPEPLHIGFDILALDSHGDSDLHDFYRDVRQNGHRDDEPERRRPGYELPNDGRCTMKGEKRDYHLYGVKHSDQLYYYEVRYDAGPKDRAWMEQADRNYLTRILKEGKFHLPLPGGQLVPLSDPRVDAQIHEDLSYNMKTNPVSINLQNSIL